MGRADGAKVETGDGEGKLIGRPAIRGRLFHPMEDSLVDGANPATGRNGAVHGGKAIAESDQGVFNAARVALDDGAADGFEALAQTGGLDDEHAGGFGMIGEKLDQGLNGGAHMDQRVGAGVRESLVQGGGDSLADGF